MPKTHIALLRGINVGGRNKLPMRELVALVTNLGASNVRTYIQSGNVVFEAPRAIAARVRTALSDDIEASHGFRTTVMVRSADDLSRLVADNPVPPADTAHLHVAFLDPEPTASALATLDPSRFPGDAAFPHGRELYLHLPRGVASTKLSNAYLDATLATTSTVRNWRTVLKLNQLAQL